ncbi:spermatogenesis-associated protein 22 [Chanos chanos]|uniref:Spermatogenesis-associated protein 22 n=1 Tax=Chanos chanos TaxID=29144 RepID=A0A6J2WWY8_CHACN|nr:spermatogenesis-associated protein 22 [Chanos chanos]
MRRNESQQRPTAGCLSVPLFNQKKRGRHPLTSNPSENDCHSGGEYAGNQSPALSFFPSRYSQDAAVNYPTLPNQKSQWNKPVNHQLQQPNSKPAPPSGSMGRGPAPVPHPYKPAYIWSQRVQQKTPGRQDSMATPAPRQDCFPSNGVTTLAKSQPFGSNQPVSQQSFKTQKGTPSRVKPADEKTLRILTAVIEGMKHWSRYKDKTPLLFEIFATLDSAVTQGSHGAKNFLIRDGKDAVQCIYYENDQALPRLIRGQVHRCVGNYDPVKDVLTCVSVRAASPSEQRNALEVVRASDTEMRRLVQVLSEI